MNKTSQRSTVIYIHVCTQFHLIYTPSKLFINTCIHKFIRVRVKYINVSRSRIPQLIDTNNVDFLTGWNCIKYRIFKKLHIVCELVHNMHLLRERLCNLSFFQENSIISSHRMMFTCHGYLLPIVCDNGKFCMYMYLSESIFSCFHQ